MKINNKIISLIFFLSTINIFSHSQRNEIISIKSFKQVNFDLIDSDTLVVFDVDKTLVHNIDAWQVNKHSPEVIKFEAKLTKLFPTIYDWKRLFSIMTVQSSRPLVEPGIIKIITGLKEKDISVVALTAMQTGRFGIIPQLEVWRYNHLKSLGFLGSFENEIIILDSLKKQPVFYKGVLMANGESKGSTLGAFLNHKKLSPKRVIMFDDELDFLKSVQQECLARRVNFCGYHYLGSNPVPFDEKIALQQAELLIKDEKFYSDDYIKNI